MRACHQAGVRQRQLSCQQQRLEAAATRWLLPRRRRPRRRRLLRGRACSAQPAAAAPLDAPSQRHSVAEPAAAFRTPIVGVLAAVVVVPRHSARHSAYLAAPASAGAKLAAVISRLLQLRVGALLRWRHQTNVQAVKLLLNVLQPPALQRLLLLLLHCLLLGSAARRRRARLLSQRQLLLGPRMLLEALVRRLRRPECLVGINKATTCCT